MREKKRLNIINVGKIIIDEKLLYCENQDHVKIFAFSRYDGTDMERELIKISISGLKALYVEIGDVLRDFEELRNPR